MWEILLIELNKSKAPTLLVEDFNYYAQKAILQYINKRYTVYNMNQQIDDDLRVLLTFTSIIPSIAADSDPLINSTDIGAMKYVYNGVYQVFLPLDYLHLLNCICVYKAIKPKGCTKEGEYIKYRATRMTSDNYAMIQENYYYRPKTERPYFYIRNINRTNSLPTNTYNGTNGTDMNTSKYNVIVQEREGNVVIINNNSNFSRELSLSNGRTISTINKETAHRYGNVSPIRMELHCGKDRYFTLHTVLVDYIKTPQTIRLTQEQLNSVEDTSQLLEFPDYVCQEIVNELVKLVMENHSNPRLQTNTIVTQSAINPTQQQTK